MIARRTLGALFVSAGAARAQPWSPPRTVRMVVPYPPGGGADTTARLFAPPFTAFFGQNVVVENRPGAGSTIGAGEVARAAPDGTTLLLDASGHTVAPYLIRNLPFDYTTAFTPISRVTILPQILVVRPESPYTNLAHLLAAARAAPGRITYGSSGNASAPHIAAAVLVSRADVQMTHVPYRGGGPALQALLAGDVDFVFGTVSSSATLAQEGRVRPLAASSAQRISSLPNVPTIAEQGFPGYEQNEWNGLWGPAGLPQAAVQRLHEACLDALANETVKARLTALGAIPVGTSPGEFADFLKQDRESVAKLIREAKITLD
jgi:tripartite-type tricarboxylate transporter receptor subunit TctC